MTTFARALGAELVRVRRTLAGRLWLVGLVIALVQATGWFTVATAGPGGWDGLLAWQALYATALCGPLAALVAGSSVRREASARSGGTPWRAISPRTVRGARLVVLAVAQLAFVALLVLPNLALGTVIGMGDAPLGRFAALVGVLWCASLVWVTLGMLITQRLGLWGALGLALVWQVAGTVRAESATWLLEPWAWSVRPALPLLHIHSNGVGASRGEAVMATGAAYAALLALLLAVAVGAVAAWTGPRTPRARHGREQSAGSGAAAQPLTGAPVRRGGRRVLAAAIGTLRARGLLLLAAVVGVLLVLVRVIWTPGYVHGLVGVVLVPGLACALACAAATLQAPALRVVLTRVGAGRWAFAQLVVLGGVGVLPVVIGALLAGRYAGSLLVVGAASGAALLLLDLWLATRFGVAAAVGVTLVGCVWSAVFGGSFLADGPLWLVAPWTWAYAAQTGDRLLIAASLSLLIAPVWAYLWVRSIRVTGLE